MAPPDEPNGAGVESVEALRAELAEAKETLRAIRSGEVDGLVVSTSEGDRVFTLRGADEPYRVMLEQMSEGAASLSAELVVLYANRRLAEMLRTPLSTLVGSPIERFVVAEQRVALTELFVSGAGHVRGSGEFALLAGDRSPVEVSVSITPLPPGSQSAWSMVATDMSERARTAELLRASAQYARSLIEASLDPLVTISAEGKITDVNDATTRVTGVDRTALIGTDFSEYFTEPEKAREGYQQVFAQGSVVDYPLTIRRRDGALTDVLYNATVYRDSSGSVLGVFAAARDVTDRNRAERLLRVRERQQHAVAELGYLALSNPGLVALLDAAVLAVASGLEAEFTKVLELRPDGDLLLRAEIGFDAGLVGHAVVAGGKGSQAGYVLLAGEPVIVEELGAETRFHPAGLLTDHGVRSGVSVAIGPRERPFGVIGAHTTSKRQFSRDDISFLAAVSNVIGTFIQRAQAEQEIRTLNAELEQRVARRTEQVRAANEELEAFVYSVSHDLRAPLRAMDGFSKVLLADYAAQLDERGQHYLSRVGAGAQRMGTMIDELLRLSRVSRAQLRRDQIDLSDLARQIADELHSAEPERRVEFAIADGLTATGDRDLVRIVLENLLGNAWKFTSTREHARIELARGDHDHSTEFVVRDNGVGFDIQHADQLFKPFQRLHKANEFPGTGIGLASVHRIITRHGGHISAHGEIGRGATFTFTLEPNGDAP
jgi:PAS domain S-box-containing protein